MALHLKLLQGMVQIYQNLTTLSISQTTTNPRRESGSIRSGERIHRLSKRVTFLRDVPPFFFLQNDEGPPGLASVSHPSRRAQEPGFGSRSRGPAHRLAPLSAHPAGCLQFSPGHQRHRSPARATSLGELLGSQAPRPNGLGVSPLSSAPLLYNFSGPRYLLAPIPEGAPPPRARGAVYLALTTTMRLFDSPKRPHKRPRDGHSGSTWDKNIGL